MQRPIQPVAPDRSFAPRRWLLAVAVSVVGALVMLGALEGPFVFDDVLLIPSNHYVHDLSHWPRWLTGTLWDTNYDVSMLEARAFWRPLVTASYAVDWAVGAGSPLGFHVTNLMVHSVNAALLFYVLFGWCRSLWAAFAGALLFAVHPVQTESVAWIAGRTDSLAMLGLLATTLGVRLWRRNRWAGALVQGLGLVVAFTSKEMAVVLPVLVSIEVWADRRRPLDPAEIRAVLRAASPYAAIAIAFAIAHHTLSGSTPLDPAVSARHRLPLILEAYGRYVSLIAWPSDLTMGRALLRVDGNYYVPDLRYSALGLAAIAAALGGAARHRQRDPLLALALAGSVGMLVPVSGVAWLGYTVLVAPRFLYIPMLMVCLSAAALMARVKQVRPLLVAAYAAGILALSVRTAVRASDYGSAQDFWRREIQANPHYTPAQEYFMAREIQASRPRAALALATLWLQAPPDVPAWFKEKLVVKTLASLLALTPDRDREGLSQVLNFATTILSGRPATLSVSSAGLTLNAGVHPRLLSRLQIEERSLRMMAAEAAVRLGDDATALAQISLARQGCDSCWTLLGTSALLTAQAGRTQEALVLARRARQLADPGKMAGLVETITTADHWRQRADQHPTAFNQAGFYTSLGCYGRAYVAARDVLSAPPAAPGARRALAELAYQAGDVTLANRLLTGAFPDAERLRLLKGFEGTARWRDRPRSKDEWSPPAASLGS